MSTDTSSPLSTHSSSSFSALGVPASLTAVLAERGITTPSPIQAATLPDSLAGRDVLGRGRTGSGKTYAFLLPMLARLAESGQRRQTLRPRALILVPTRELALQIDEALIPLAKPLGLTSRTIFGGVGQAPQVQAIARGVDVIVACPGRLEDLMGQGRVKLDAIEITVLDEADHMADLGFLPGVKRILDATPRGSQRMLFSATLDAGISGLVKRYLVKPATHEADSEQSPVTTMTHHVLQVTAEDHLAVLVDLAAAPGRTVVFTRTKHRAKKFARALNAAGVPAVELHGNLSQGARTRTMAAFHSGKAPTLVATDIAARGIHVDDVGLVIHADPPMEHKAYLHRSGRTARAGHAGVVVTLTTAAQRGDVRDLTRKAGITVTPTTVTPSSALLHEIAPGEREFSGAFQPVVATEGGKAQATSVGSRRPHGGEPRGRAASRGSNPGRPANGRAGSKPASGESRRSAAREDGRGSDQRPATRSANRTGAEDSRRGVEPARGAQQRRGSTSRSAQPTSAGSGDGAKSSASRSRGRGAGSASRGSGAAAFSTQFGRSGRRG